MFFHLILTTKCDLKCKYCYEKSCEDIDSDFGDFEIDYSVPSRISYDLETLEAFLSKDAEPSLIFYGGEPMLCIEDIKRIMDRIKARSFVVQTNGLHLKKLEPEYLNKFDTIFVSIDGDENLTDFYRGKGVYRKVVENVNFIRKIGFRGEIVARMTVMEQTDIYNQVLWLLNNPDCSFSSVHWQIDAGFWKTDFEKRPFAKWVEESYNVGIRRLVRFWVEHMEKYGRVLRIYPFLGVVESLLKGEPSLLRCGSGWANYSIQTDGHIIPCPIMGGMKDFYLGHIENSHPLRLKKVFVGSPCTTCEIRYECGGRCLYANLTKRWSSEAYALVCKTVKNMIDCLKAVVPRIKQLIYEGKISFSDFNYTKYNGCEVIP